MFILISSAICTDHYFLLIAFICRIIINTMVNNLNHRISQHSIFRHKARIRLVSALTCFDAIVFLICVWKMGSPGKKTLIHLYLCLIEFTN